MIYRINEEVEKFKNVNIKPVSKSIRYSAVVDQQKGNENFSLPSGNAFESMARTNPEAFNNAKLKAIQSSKNLVQDFNKYFSTIIEGNITDFNNLNIFQILNGDNIREFNTTLYNGLIEDYRELARSIGESEAKRAVTEMYVPESLTEEGCRKLISIRIKNSRILTDSLTKLLKTNYQALGISSAEAKHLIFELSQDSLNNKAVGKIKDILKNPDHLKKFRMGDYNYDFRSIGGACIFLSEDPSIQFSQHPSKRLYDIFKYDAIVTGHGGIEPMKGNVKDVLRDGKSRKWTIQPISTLTQSNLTTVVDVLRALKKEGFKNVYVGACNPGSIDLPRDIIMDKNFKVHMGSASVYLESEFTNDEFYNNLTILEQELLNMAIENNSNYIGYSLNELYSEYDSLEKDYILNEGVIDALKSFVKKAVQIIIEIWRRLVEFFKSIYTKISTFIRDKFENKSSNRTKKPIEVNFVSMHGNNATVEKAKANTPDEITSIIQKANKTINDAIRYHSSKETSHIKKLEQLVNSGRLKKDTNVKKESCTIFRLISLI